MNTPEEIKKVLSEIELPERKPNPYTIIRNENGFKELEHRIVWRKYKGEIPKGMVIHHINQNKKDNRIENLQLVTFQEHRNIHKVLRKSTTF